MNDLPKIPSEYIEPYLLKYLSGMIEGVGLGLFTPAEARADLKGVEYFVSCFCEIHARYATSNRYGQFCRLSDEEMINICKKVLNESQVIDYERTTS